MGKPVVMTVDDEPNLNAIARDLQGHYQEEFHIVKARSGSEALEAVQEFKRRDTPVALFLVDQRMPAMSGTEFLAEAIKLFPESKRVLLTAYADTDAAIASINALGLDYYLMKPWDPPEERLYPVLDDLLGDWLTSAPSSSGRPRLPMTQAKRLGAEILSAHEVAGVRVDDPYRIVTLDDGTELSCRALLLATGVKVRELDVPGIESLVGASVYYGAATSEAINYKGGRAFVIGGGNSAGQGAIYLSRYAKEVALLVRTDSLKQSMSSYLIDQIASTENISVRTGTEVTAVTGSGHLETVTVKNRSTSEMETLPADAIFIFIGAVPCSQISANIVELSSDGFIVTGPDLIRDGRRPRRAGD